MAWSTKLMLCSRAFICFSNHNVKTSTIAKCNKTAAKMLHISTNDEFDIMKPPASVRDMKVLSKKVFLKTITVPIIKTHANNVSNIIKHLKKYFLKLEQFRPVSKDSDLTTIILNPIHVNVFLDINEEDRQVLSRYGITNENFTYMEIQLKFKNYSVEEIFRAVLPTDKEGMASFTKVGHIVHVNLREHLLPYKQIIGEVLINKVPNCRTVVNKINIIDNTYRNFKMETLAGEEDYLVSLKENKCIFEFDFSKVYWNSRLCTEHERIVNIIQSDEVLFDVFAGVGPFAVPVAKRGGVVWANDLNPESFKWLQHNVMKNKVSQNIKMFNKDGKDFILEEIRNELIQCIKNGKTVHITMNLPALAYDFLKYFQGLYNEEDFIGIEEIKTPIIYLYCFAKGEETEEITMNLINEAMKKDMTKYIKDLFKVRTVSNFKEMMRVTIALEKDILLEKYGNSTLKRKGDCEDYDSENSKKFCQHGEKEREQQQCV